MTGPQGEQGLTGPQGPQGATGPKGDTGPQGATSYGLNARDIDGNRYWLLTYPNLFWKDGWKYDRGGEGGRLLYRMTYDGYFADLKEESYYGGTELTWIGGYYDGRPKFTDTSCSSQNERFIVPNAATSSLSGFVKIYGKAPNGSTMVGTSGATLSEVGALADLKSVLVRKGSANPWLAGSPIAEVDTCVQPNTLQSLVDPGGRLDYWGWLSYKNSYSISKLTFDYLKLLEPNNSLTLN